jgi:hypothetical protein
MPSNELLLGHLETLSSACAPLPKGLVVVNSFLSPNLNYFCAATTRELDI